MNLTEVPEAVIWPETHYVFVEKTGPCDDFAIENYVNDPRVTPADRLVTEILIPAE